MFQTILLKAIRVYQATSFFHHAVFKTLFLTDSVCRFTPTCSEYTYQAIEKYGALRGVYLGIRRIIKCHPWSEGGEDLVP